MKGSHFVKKYSVQFVNQQRQAVRAVLLRRPQAARVVADLAGAAQRVRPDDARTTPASTASKVHEGARVLEVLFEGDAGRRRAGASRRTARSARCGRRWSSTPAGRARCIIDRLGPARVGPGAEEGRRCGPTGRAPTATPAATRGRRSSSRPKGKKGWFWYIPLHDDIVSVGVVAGLRLPVQEPRRRRTSRRSTSRRSRRAPGLQPRIANADAVRHLPRPEGVLLPRASRRPATAGCWSATPSASSTRCTRPGVLLALTSGAMAADAIAEGLAKGDTSEAQLRQVGAGRSSRAWTACGGWCASSTTASASAGSSRSTRT